MSDKEWFLERDAKPSLYGWIFSHMAMGAAYAGMALVAIMGVVLILYSLGQLLPDASKEAPPPMPQIEGQLQGQSPVRLI